MKTAITTLMMVLLVIMSSFVQSPFSALVSANNAQYGTYQVKITYLGSQEKSCISLLLYGSLRTANGAEFEPYRTPGVNYSNDSLPFNAMMVTGTSIKKFVDALNLRPDIKVSGGSNTPQLSLMIEKGTSPGELVFEHLADYTEAHGIMNILEGAVATEPTTTKTTIRRFRNQSIGHH